MAAILENIIPSILQLEGGFVNHPNDPGGATNFGITLRTYRKFFGEDKTVEDLKNIPTEHKNHIYEVGYWNPIKGYMFQHEALAATVFDFAVNGGVPKAAKTLQYVLNVYFNKQLVVDGIIGTLSLEAVNSLNQDEAKACFVLYNDVRKIYYAYRADLLKSNAPHYAFVSSLTNPDSSSSVFYKGWINRVNKISAWFFPDIKKKYF